MRPKDRPIYDGQDSTLLKTLTITNPLTKVDETFYLAINHIYFDQVQIHNNEGDTMMCIEHDRRIIIPWYQYSNGRRLPRRVGRVAFCYDESRLNVMEYFESEFTEFPNFPEFKQMGLSGRTRYNVMADVFTHYYPLSLDPNNRVECPITSFGGRHAVQL